MNYPDEILPKLNYKLIDCNIDDYYLVRHTNQSDRDLLWDKEAGQVIQKAICDPTSNIRDLSTSLFSIYTTSHIPIQFTKEGITEYAVECLPNTSVTPPIHETHFVMNHSRGHWVIKIGDIHNQEANYSFGDRDGNFIAICRIIHTPMKWNFWHFSIRWFLPDKNQFLNEIEDTNEKEYKKTIKRLGSEARALIAKFASLDTPNSAALKKNCYQN